MQLGVIGLGTMGGNLARNAARNGATVVLFNRTPEKTDRLVADHGGEGEFVATKTLEEFVKALRPPRPILLMVKAGSAVDDMMRQLEPLLEEDDILIDGGNSLYVDTQRREKEAASKGFGFVGMGVSGGEEGALKGPSMMPGGDRKSYDHLRPLLEKMGADDGEGGRCVSYMGPGGAGHFVKMVHNGIEYGIMQLIAETYDLLKAEGKLTNAEFSELFAQWAAGDDLQSFLIEITARIFTRKDPETGKDLVDVIRDTAGQKGTGKWTTEAAMHYGVAVPTVTAAVDARILSGDADLRKRSEGTLPESLFGQEMPKAELLLAARHALALSTITAYVQGFELIARASAEEKWGIDLAEVARIWRGGGVIRSVLLRDFQSAMSAEAQSGAKDPILRRFSAGQQRWRAALMLGTARGVPMPAPAASLAYYDSARRPRLPQNLIQAQRDFFGAHTFARVDKEGVFHADWSA